MVFILSVSGLVGFFISFYIWYKKNKKQPLFCLIGKDCNAVLGSLYARTWGVRNEVIGMLYYGGVIFVTIWWGSGMARSATVLLLTTAASILAVLFSLYLIVVQARILKRWCSWCILSTFVNGIIFFLLFSLLIDSPLMFNF